MHKCKICVFSMSIIYFYTSLNKNFRVVVPGGYYRCINCFARSGRAWTSAGRARTCTGRAWTCVLGDGRAPFIRWWRSLDHQILFGSVNMH